MVEQLTRGVGDEACIETQLSLPAAGAKAMQAQAAELRALHVPVHVGPDHPQMHQPLKPTLVGP